jgi:hypothetical protein
VPPGSERVGLCEFLDLQREALTDQFLGLSEVDLTFRLADEDTVETVVAHYRQQIADLQEIVSSFDLEMPCAWPEMTPRNLRWVALNMIEEAARQVGHADIIRETIDSTRSS